MPRLGRLGDLVRRPDVRRAVAQAPRELPLRQRASAVAALTWTGSAVAADPVTTIGLAAFAIVSDCAPDTWLVRPSAAGVIDQTDLHAIPSEPPRLLRRAGVVEAHRPETGDRLWGDYVSLAWYEANEALYLFGVFGPEHDESCRTARWTPQWTGEDLEPQLPSADIASPHVDSIGRHHQFAVDAARFLLALGLHAEVESSPLRIELERDKRDPKRRTHHVYVRDGVRSPRAAPPPSELAAGRVELRRPVRGHFKRQRHGEGRAQTKWIYVQDYEARRRLTSSWIVSAATEGGPG